MSAVSPAAPHELFPALRLLFGDQFDPVPTGLDPSGLFVARAGERVCGAILAQTLPGALGTVCPPLAPAAEVEDSLTRAACDWLRGRGAKVAQAFASPEERHLVAPLERHGFRHVTQLVFLRREIEQPPGRTGSCDLLAGIPPRPGERDRFAAALLATNEESLDCPELNGTRTPEELLAGFAPVRGTASWQFHPDTDGNIVGVSQVERDDGVLTIAYLGVVPAARGRGNGGRILRRILSEAVGCGGGKVTAVEVSADVRNEPALRLYRRHDFIETDRREVFLAHWPG
jgi:ribosomal protein S18 acetylase RimI-like enzyme